MSPFLALHDLEKRYGATRAVAGVSLDIAQGESLALLGPSGCGKTTTLRMLAGLIAPTAGRIRLMDRDITTTPAHRRNMGYVFQSYALFPHMTVARNIGFGLDERGIGRAERDSQVREALAMVRLTGLEERRPRELSGGQQQRVALARALVIRPDVLLLDESLSNLDAKLRDAMRIEIRDLQKRLGVTTLFVTHDQTEALTLCDRIAVMNAGRIEQIAGPREIYDQPATRFVADFVGRSNVLSGTSLGDGVAQIGDQRIRLANRLPAGPVQIYLRPQRLRLQAADQPTKDADNAIAGRIASRLFVGDRLEVLVDTRIGRLTVEVASRLDAPPDGTETIISFAPQDALAFQDGGS
jgi:putative spermidine/putrescine transport system ATP-binding protein